MDSQQLVIANGRVVVIEVSWAKLEDAQEYLAGHIPGAVHLNTDDIESGYPEWRLRPLPELQGVIGDCGITATTTVVVYGSQVIAAARAWWALLFAGVSDVRLLDGGADAWRRAGFALETAIPRNAPVLFQAAPRNEVLATTAWVQAHLDSPTAALCDARSDEEFAGRESGYSYLEARGRIPGAIHIGNADDSANIYSNPDGTLADSATVLGLWRESGLIGAEDRDFDREVVFYCGSGWRSSLAFFHAWRIGFNKFRNYSDGWSGWSTTYAQDTTVTTTTAGWRQEPTGNPIVHRYA